jgi:zinc transporter, ZIP family
MSDFAVFLLFTSIMGLSIFLSLPVVYSRRAQGRAAVMLNAIAIGILIFLLADVFSDATTILYTSSNGGYLSDPRAAFVFGAAFVAAFLVLYVVDHRPGRTVEGRPRFTALIIALGIGFQNLTEGMVFGYNWTIGALGLLSVIFLGFFLQNVTEGFPIASPFLGTSERRNLGLLAGLFLIGGLPTILGGAIGYFYHSSLLDLLFDALAIGAIAYVILPMIRGAFRPAETIEATYRKARLVYFGVLVGFVIGFAVNAL